MREKLNFTSIFLMVIGLLFVLWSIWGTYQIRSVDKSNIGMFSLGMGLLLFGFTNGFSDMTTQGRFLSKFGMFALIVGLLIYGYIFYLMFQGDLQNLSGSNLNFLTESVGSLNYG